MASIEIRIPHELMDAAFKHPDVEKHTRLLAERVAKSVNNRLRSRGINIEYRVNAGRRSGAKPRPFANVYPESTGDTSPADWGRARAFLQAAIGEHSKGGR